MKSRETAGVQIKQEWVKNHGKTDSVWISRRLTCRYYRETTTKGEKEGNKILMESFEGYLEGCLESCCREVRGLKIKR